MGDNNNKKDELPYQIPGVIIPEQVTDSGKVVGTSDTKDTLKDIKNNSEESNQSIYETPGIIIPSQNVNGKVIPKKTNVSEDPIKEDQKKPLVDYKTPPILPGMPPEKPQIEREKLPEQKIEPTPISDSKPKKEKKSNHKISLFIIIILLAGLLYLVYKTYLNPEIKTPKSDSELNKQVFNKSGYLVQELYSWINLTGCNSRNDIFYNDQRVVASSSLKTEDKNYLAYRMLKHQQLMKKNCSNYPTSLHINDKDKKWYCGEDYLFKSTTTYSDSDDLTYIINGDDLKKQTEKMFGKGEYQPLTFTTGINNRYLYDQTTDAYILQSADGEDTCDNYTTTLTSVDNDDTSVTLHVKIVNGTTKNEVMYHYKFMKTDDGNYYFQELTKG